MHRPSATLPPAPSAVENLSFELARAIIERDPVARTLPRVDASWSLDEAVRLLTAGKGYTAAPSVDNNALAAMGKSHCPHCSKRMDPHEQLGYRRDAQGRIVSFHHRVCP